jgi:hypothetical protein
VHDPPNAGPEGGIDQRSTVLDGTLESGIASGEPDPVRVVEGVRAAQVLDEPGGFAEVERSHVDPIPERARPAPVSGDRPNLSTRRQQPLGDVPAGVPERPGDHVTHVVHAGC